MTDYTLVCGVDRKHLQQLAMVWPTWRLHKPSLFVYPMIVFRDEKQVSCDEIREVIDHPNLSIYSWPMGGVEYHGTPYGDKWDEPQRKKMIAGFVHIAATFVRTPYWLKVDTDTVASGENNWIDESWFADTPAIIAHGWSFTKPANQMVLLDEWVDKNKDNPVMEPLSESEPLNIIPKPGWSRVRHSRIISWCAFFNTQFTKLCAAFANATCGAFRLPVYSQDGFMWYCAKRLGRPIAKPNMKSRGWIHRSSMKGIADAVAESLNV